MCGQAFQAGEDSFFMTAWLQINEAQSTQSLHSMNDYLCVLCASLLLSNLTFYFLAFISNFTGLIIFFGSRIVSKSS